MPLTIQSLVTPGDIALIKRLVGFLKFLFKKSPEPPFLPPIPTLDIDSKLIEFANVPNHQVDFNSLMIKVDCKPTKSYHNFTPNK